MVRSFVAVDIGVQARQEIMEFIKAFQRKGFREGIRWVKEDQLHITLKFLGNVSPALLEKMAERLKDECSGLPAFVVQLGGTGFFFSGRTPRVFWVDVKQGKNELKRLFSMVEAVAEEFGFPRETRAYNPHLTLARIKGGPSAKRLVEGVRNIDSPRFTLFEVNEVHIMRSELLPAGARYSKLHTLRLKL